MGDFAVYVTRERRRGIFVDVEADDSAAAAFAAYRLTHPDAPDRPLVRYDARTDHWFVDGVEMLIYPPPPEDDKCFA